MILPGIRGIGKYLYHKVIYKKIMYVHTWKIYSQCQLLDYLQWLYYVVDFTEMHFHWTYNVDVLTNDILLYKVTYKCYKK